MTQVEATRDDDDPKKWTTLINLSKLPRKGSMDHYIYGPEHGIGFHYASPLPCIVTPPASNPAAMANTVGYPPHVGCEEMA
jgi:hypothetical protein